MKYMKEAIITGIAATVLTLMACNDNRNGDSSRMNSGTDTNAMDTRRNSTDTTNYLTKDSGNKSQETIDPNPPQNSKY